MHNFDSLILATGSRLHFGLFGGKCEQGSSFGGIGAMVEKPGLKLKIEASEERRYSGSQSDRLQAFADSWLEFTGHSPEEEFHLSMVESPNSHVGLGTGTQIGLSVAAILFQHLLGEIPSLETLARSVNRGKRSAVGTYGFQHGGFILDQGKSNSSELAKLGLHCPIPEQWRFVLIQSSNPEGLSGSTENDVFANSAVSMSEHHDELVRLTKDSILPALYAEDFDTFSESVFEFGKLSGSYFAHIQGGPFNGPRITKLVESARQNGIKGVGQSSWGPTVYVMAESDNDANQITELMSEFLLPEESMFVTAPENSGFRITAVPQATP